MCRECRERALGRYTGGCIDFAGRGNIEALVRVYVILDDRTSLEIRSATPSRCSSAGRMRSGSSTRCSGDDPELARYVRIEERELEAGGRAGGLN